MNWVESAPCRGKGFRWSVEGAEHQRRGKRWKRVVRGEYSRLAFFYVCIFVTAGEGEELIVDIIGRHCACGWKKFGGGFQACPGDNGGDNGGRWGCREEIWARLRGREEEGKERGKPKGQGNARSARAMPRPPSGSF